MRHRGAGHEPANVDASAVCTTDGVAGRCAAALGDLLVSARAHGRAARRHLFIHVAELVFIGLGGAVPRRRREEHLGDIAPLPARVHHIVFLPPCVRVLPQLVQRRLRVQADARLHFVGGDVRRVDDGARMAARQVLSPLPLEHDAVRPRPHAMSMLQIILVLAVVLAPVRPHVHTMAVHFILEVVALVTPAVGMRQNAKARAFALHPRASVHTPIPPRHVTLPCLHSLQIFSCSRRSYTYTHPPTHTTHPHIYTHILVYICTIKYHTYIKSVIYTNIY